MCDRPASEVEREIAALREALEKKQKTIERQSMICLDVGTRIEAAENRAEAAEVEIAALREQLADSERQREVRIAQILLDEIDKQEARAEAAEALEHKWMIDFGIECAKHEATRQRAEAAEAERNRLQAKLDALGAIKA